MITEHFGSFRICSFSVVDIIPYIHLAWCWRTRRLTARAAAEVFVSHHCIFRIPNIKSMHTNKRIGYTASGCSRIKALNAIFRYRYICIKCHFHQIVQLSDDLLTWQIYKNSQYEVSVHRPRNISSKHYIIRFLSYKIYFFRVLALRSLTHTQYYHDSPSIHPTHPTEKKLTLHDRKIECRDERPHSQMPWPRSYSSPIYTHVYMVYTRKYNAYEIE